MTLHLVGKALFYSAPVIVLLGFAGPSLAASANCGTEIDRVQAQLDAVLARRAAAGPSAKESGSATMRRQPTPESVARAEAQLGDWPGAPKAIAALQDARNAKARGNQRACLSALEVARGIIQEAER